MAFEVVATTLLAALLSTIPLELFAAKQDTSGEADATGAQVVHYSGIANPFHRRKGVEEPRNEQVLHCFRANSSFGESSCNCFGLPRPQTTDSKAAVTIVVGGWLGANVDAWILKLLIEEQLGRPTELIPDLDLMAEGQGVWGALKSGYAMMYPEVAQRAGRHVSCQSCETRPSPIPMPGLVFARRRVLR